MLLLIFGLQEVHIRPIQFSLCFLYAPGLTYFVRVKGVLSGLQGRFFHIISLQYSLDGHIFIFVGADSLAVELISSTADGFFNGMCQRGWPFCLCFLEPQMDCFLLRWSGR